MSLASSVGDAVVTSQLCFEVLKALNAVALSKSHDKAVVELHRLRSSLSVLEEILKPNDASHVHSREQVQELFRNELSQVRRDLRVCLDLLGKFPNARLRLSTVQISFAMEKDLAPQFRRIADDRLLLDSLLTVVHRGHNQESLSSPRTLKIPSDKSFTEEDMRIQNWLAGTDQLEKHFRLTERHGESTGDWILAGSKYLEWLDSSNSFVWLSGTRTSSYPDIQ